MPARFQHGCRKSPVQHRARRGAAAVEFAVCLPVLVLLVFGSIEASSFIFLKQSISVSAYEGVRDAIRNEGSNATARQRIENILNSRGVQGYAVAFPSGESADADRGDEIVVEVSAPTQPNSPLAGQFIANRTIRSRVVMIKE
ncbi:TadE/TadG family type IV pilus assembly protein [Crateriforma conspicua]|uniref:TadE/TadG family type IV pilus assembly protein n=1 Tax=Crateriforma conspicua TaxID=2527996 RepID=UPI0011A8CF04|nr:TadE/TadG family type IV pilus assembly protein [Crateriforma conspicua]